jgi:hypothetical protein
MRDSRPPCQSGCGLPAYVSLAGGLLHHEVAQALVIFMARRAPYEVRRHAGEMRVGVLAGDLEVDVLVQKLEALLARHLGARRAEQPGD